MGRRLASLLLFILLIIILLMAVYYLNDVENEVVVIKDDFTFIEPLVVYGDSELVSLEDDYVDPLDQEIMDLDYRDETESGTGSNDDDFCFIEAECGVDYTEDAYCIGDRLYEKVHDFSCDGECREDVDRVLVEDCLIRCEDGQCIDSYPFDCEFDFDCSFNDFVGDTYCLPDDNVHQYYATWTCLNPGSSDSMCHVGLQSLLVEECGTGVTCDEGMCVSDSYH